MAKRPSAFDQALIEGNFGPETETKAEAKTVSVASKPEQAVELLETTKPVIQYQEISEPIAAIAGERSQFEKPKNKGGRPPSAIAKKKATYNLREDIGGEIADVQRKLARYTENLIKVDGEVIDQAVEFMQFCLNDPASRPQFLELYQHWLDNRSS